MAPHPAPPILPAGRMGIAFHERWRSQNGGRYDHPRKMASFELFSQRRRNRPSPLKKRAKPGWVTLGCLQLFAPPSTPAPALHRAAGRHQSQFLDTGRSCRVTTHYISGNIATTVDRPAHFWGLGQWSVRSHLRRTRSLGSPSPVRCSPDDLSPAHVDRPCLTAAPCLPSSRACLS